MRVNPAGYGLRSFLAFDRAGCCLTGVPPHQGSVCNPRPSPCTMAGAAATAYNESVQPGLMALFVGCWLDFRPHVRVAAKSFRRRTLSAQAGHLCHRGGGIAAAGGSRLPGFLRPVFSDPDSNQQIVFFASLELLIFLLFVALTFVLVRNLLKLFAERRLGVLGSKFRTRLVVVSLLLSFLPVIVMFWFAYGLMNHSLDKWFSSPVEEVRRDTAAMAALLSTYAAQNAHAEAVSLAAARKPSMPFPDTAFPRWGMPFGATPPPCRADSRWRFWMAMPRPVSARPRPGRCSKSHFPCSPADRRPASLYLGATQTEYILGSAPVGEHGMILVGMPLPKQFSETRKQIEASQQQYLRVGRAAQTGAPHVHGACCCCSPCWCCLPPPGWHCFFPSW